MSDIFISYARSTAAQAGRVVGALRSEGYSVWLDDQIPAHRAYTDVIVERLEAAKAVVVVWSAEAAKSEWVRSEASRARALGKLVQLTLDGAALPMPFDQIECANLVGWNGRAAVPAWRKVLASVAELAVAAQAEPGEVGAEPPGARARRPRRALASRRRTVGGAALAFVAVAVFLGRGLVRHSPVPPSPAPATSAGAPGSGAPAAGSSADAVQRTIAAHLPAIPCSWLSMVGASARGGQVVVTLTGVAGSTRSFDALSQLAPGADVEMADANLTDGTPFDARVCAALEAFSAVRAGVEAGAPRVSILQTRVVMERQPDGAVGKRVVVTMAPGDSKEDFALFGIDPAGTVSTIIADRRTFEKASAAFENRDFVYVQAANAWRLTIMNTPPAGLQGLLLLTGRGPFPSALITSAPAARGADWARRIAAAARAGAWKADMAWFRSVDPAGG